MNICVLSKIPNLAKELRNVIPSAYFLEAQTAQDDSLRNSSIVIADYDLIAPHIYNLQHLKWLQGTWAGLDVITPFIDKPLPFLLTRFSGDHFGRMMSEYVISNIVNHERDFDKVYKNQIARNWNIEGKIHSYRVISDLTIGILGIGQIGSRVGKILHTLGAKILGLGRSSKIEHSEEYSFLSEYYTFPLLSDLLKNSDYVVNTLPTTNDTKGLLNNCLLENCKGTVFINVGRGSIIDENELIKALKNGWISGAILDVFENEPLSKESLLWTMDHVKITPHVSAVSKANHIAEQFKENLKLYEDHKPIPATVNFDTKY